MSRFLPIVLVLLCPVLAGRARAQSCTGSATPVVFGNYQPLNGQPSVSTGTVTVTCYPGVVAVLMSYSIALGAGGGGSYAGRSMGGTGGRLAYQLYTDALYAQVWGDGSAGTSAVTGGYLLGVLLAVTNNYTAFGRIPASSNAIVGSYSDIESVVITY